MISSPSNLAPEPREISGRFPGGRFYQIVIVAIIFSTAALFYGFKTQLDETTSQLVSAFRTENAKALAEGDLPGITTQLNSLMASVNWVCVSAAVQNQRPFFQQERGSCAPSLFQRQFPLSTKGHSDVDVQITIRLPRSSERSFAAQLCFHLFFLAVIFWGTRQAELERHGEDIERQEERRLAEAQRAKSLAELAADVRHDIKSPLATIHHLLELDARELEHNRPQLRRAATRIDDVINTLINEHSAGNPEAAGKPGIYLLSSIIEVLVSDKRQEHHAITGVDIEAGPGSSIYGLFVDVDLAQFQRTLSNLMNNAVQAIEGRGRVRICARSGPNGQVEVVIEDNGKGISPEILAKLGRRGETHGKAGGSGLGLALARTMAENAGGSLEIRSPGVGKGTTVMMRLPAAPAPSWFVSHLELPLGGTVVVLDDQESVHDLWRNRFEEHRLAERGVNVVHMHHVDTASQWILSHPENAQRATFLVDYELLGQNSTGITFIRTMGIAARAILVSTRVEELEVRSQCQDLGIRMIPKGLVGVVPITVPVGDPVERSEEHIDVVLIDDDESQRLLWPKAFEKRGYVVRTCSTPSEFLAIADTLNKETWIFVDSELGEREQRGESLTKRLFDLGFKNLVLATGHAGDKNMAAMPWLRAIVGKRSGTALEVFLSALTRERAEPNMKGRRSQA